MPPPPAGPQTPVACASSRINAASCPSASCLKILERRYVTAHAVECLGSDPGAATADGIANRVHVVVRHCDGLGGRDREPSYMLAWTSVSSTTRSPRRASVATRAELAAKPLAKEACALGAEEGGRLRLQRFVLGMIASQ
jgi:hypothetical protein